MALPDPLQRAFDVIDKKNLDALLVIGRENTRYLSGFTGSDSVLLITGKEKELHLFCDSRYTQQAGEECPAWKIVEYRKQVEAVCRRIRELKLMKVGFESRVMSYNMYHRYIEILDFAALVPLEKLIENLRVPKSASEIDRIKKAVEIAESSFEEVLPSLGAGVRENQWALELECAMRKAGSGPMPFDIIVASGKNGAMPHAKTTGKTIKKSEMVTVDFGASYEGYNCDTTITLSVGKPSKQMEGVHQVVLEAHDMAIEAAKEGIELKRLDSVARKHIEKRGYGKYFGHGLGHGVGLSVHEEPSISQLSEGYLEAGSVVTIEPGIYIPGVGGVRIEDMILVQPDGVEVLTRLPKYLRII